MRKALKLIKAAKRPVILAGRGIELSGARAEVLAFGERDGAADSATAGDDSAVARRAAGGRLTLRVTAGQAAALIRADAFAADLRAVVRE